MVHMASGGRTQDALVCVAFNIPQVFIVVSLYFKFNAVISTVPIFSMYRWLPKRAVITSITDPRTRAKGLSLASNAIELAGVF